MDRSLGECGLNLLSDCKRFYSKSGVSLRVPDGRFHHCSELVIAAQVPQQPFPNRRSFTSTAPDWHCRHTPTGCLIAIFAGRRAHSFRIRASASRATASVSSPVPRPRFDDLAQQFPHAVASGARPPAHGGNRVIIAAVRTAISVREQPCLSAQWPRMYIMRTRKRTSGPPLDPFPHGGTRF